MTEEQFTYIAFMLSYIAFTTSDNTFSKVMFGTATLLNAIIIAINLLKVIPSFL